MANIHIECRYCGSTAINVRSSQRVTANTVASELFCTRCLTRHTVHTEVVRVRIPHFEDCQAALQYDKPFKEVDPNQLEIPTDSAENKGAK